MKTMSTQESFMERCLALAEQGRGAVGNGALVGAVLVRGGNVIAEGFHSGFGRPHAERDLLQKFDQKIRSEDMLYVNLEPCCHEGKTPPCTDLLIERGIKHVVIGMTDPDQRVAGKGIEQLRKDGVEVVGPVLDTQCRWLNRGFVSVRTMNRPWITLKQARTVPGETSGKITDERQDRWSHTWLRAKHDAILVGAETIRTDDPLMNTRFDQNKKVDQKIPYRIVINKNCDLNISSKIFSDPDRGRTIAIVSEEAERSAVSLLGNQGVRVIRLPWKNNQVEWNALWDALCTPRDSYAGITSLLVEGGPVTWKIFKDAELVDEEVTLVG